MSCCLIQILSSSLNDFPSRAFSLLCQQCQRAQSTQACTVWCLLVRQRLQELLHHLAGMAIGEKAMGWGWRTAKSSWENHRKSCCHMLSIVVIWYHHLQSSSPSNMDIDWNILKTHIATIRLYYSTIVDIPDRWYTKCFPLLDKATCANPSPHLQPGLGMLGVAPWQWPPTHGRQKNVSWELSNGEWQTRNAEAIGRPKHIPKEYESWSWNRWVYVYVYIICDNINIYIYKSIWVRRQSTTLGLQGLPHSNHSRDMMRLHNLPRHSCSPGALHSRLQLLLWPKAPWGPEAKLSQSDFTKVQPFAGQESKAVQRSCPFQIPGTVVVLVA